MKSDEFSKRVNAGVSLKESEFEVIKKELVEKFLSEYEGEVIQQ
jgi:hypothetical protein